MMYVVNDLDCGFLGDDVAMLDHLPIYGAVLFRMGSRVAHNGNWQMGH